MSAARMLTRVLKVPGLTTPRDVAALFPKTADEVVRTAEEVRDNVKANVATLLASEPSGFDSAWAVDVATADFSSQTAALSVVKSVAVDKEVRDAATKAIVELQALAIDLFSGNRDMYRWLKKIPAAAMRAAGPQEAYWLDEKLADYEREGHGLPDAEFARVVAIKKELTALSTEFSTNIAEDKTKLYFTREELAGTPDSVVKNLAEHDGKLAVTLDMPTYFGVVKNCTVAATRHAVAAAFNNRAYPANAAILTKVIALRHELATLLGFKSYAHLDLDSKMAKTPERAQAFISELVPGLQRKWDVERAKLLADLPSSVTVDDQGRIHGYDINFLINQYKSKFLSVDETALQEHFEMEHTVASLMRIYEAFFDVSFENIPAGPELGLWHDSVSLIRATDKRSGRLLGHIAQDLFPREGKYSHACCYGVVPALRDAATDAFTPAVAVVIANFPKPTADRPSLLMHSDVETYFHEFGHAIHGLLGRSNMPTQSGTRVKRDFVELPSQILEEWMWEPSILTIVGKHHKTGEPLPAALIQSKANSQNAFSGTESLRQLYFASLALRLFGPEFPTKMGDDVNAADRLFVAIQKEIQQSVVYDEETHFTGTFGHLMGYGATYYGYMWSEVFATDVFDSIKAANGLMDASVGRRYGDIILGPGGSRDPFDMLREFLGREPSNVGFLKKLGIDA